MKKTLISLFLLLLFPALASAATASIEAEDTSIYETWLPEDGTMLNVLVSVSGATSEGELQLSFTDVSEK